MLTRRIIPCLDVLNGRVVKGRRFINLVDVADPLELAARYSAEGADEIVLLDISATIEERKPFFDIVRGVARRVSIPLTVGGGIRSVEDIVALLHCGADKVSLNTVLTENPSILTEAAARVGSQALVGAIDAFRIPGTAEPEWGIRVKSGTKPTGLDALDWARKLETCGAGELLVTSINRDGTKDGYDVDLLSRLAGCVKVPVVASGGAGTKEHIISALRDGKADAVLAASIFHFDELPIPELKNILRKEGIPVR
jgi:imidazole glycerol-phosphate synthase subunit HisF